ncbi:unnamed protein product [Vitrella brassicaformis CCMP3155]|uniref:Uncharacterized protein n=1 Tax=Vitrella brassicaformis (strain CCMP3155) TaxID=1169540 RepID=A0A0G4EAC8_VITBC|nr:unnamed protein product [Vitrella brassicaformis CCMP3155]|eukprot:CEL92430.1 unnamed protein product [Vitrella brassicaformis CCMP3155]
MQRLSFLFLACVAARAAGGRFGCYQYVHPRPGSDMVSAVTTIAVRQGHRLLPETIENKLWIKGEQTGELSGWHHIANDGKTLIVNIPQPFAPGERVFLKIIPGIATLDGSVCEEALEYNFKVSWKPVREYRSAWALGSATDPTLFNPWTVPQARESVQPSDPKFHNGGGKAGPPAAPGIGGRQLEANATAEMSPEERRRMQQKAAKESWERFVDAVNRHGMPPGDRAAYEKHREVMKTAFKQYVRPKAAQRGKGKGHTIKASAQEANTGDGDGQEGEEVNLRASSMWTAPYKDWKTIPGDLPLIDVKHGPAQGLSKGFIFSSNMRYPEDQWGAYLIISDDVGQPVWFKRVWDDGYIWSLIDLKVQRNGNFTYHDTNASTYVEMGHDYEICKRYFPGHGYFANAHDFQVNEKGHSLMIVYQTEGMDVKAMGIPEGQEDAQVIGGIIQEIDTSGNVIFEWRMWDHLPEAMHKTVGLGQKSSKVADPIHINAIDWTTDGHITASLRHFDQVIKINRLTGDIIWRLGGPGNEFTWVDEDRPFSHQHDVRLHEDSHLTVYSNDNLHDWPPPRYSRAVEYWLDEPDRLIKKVREYRSPENYYGMATGSMQRFTNGNLGICWGGVGRPEKLPFYTEVSPTGERLLELEFTAQENSYRALRYDWWGIPKADPWLILDRESNPPQLHMSWNGATVVAKWKIWHGHFREANQFADVIVKRSFEEIYPLHKGVAQERCHYFQVEAMSWGGKPLRRSNPVFSGWGNESDCPEK